MGDMVEEVDMVQAGFLVMKIMVIIRKSAMAVMEVVAVDTEEILMVMVMEVVDMEVILTVMEVATEEILLVMEVEAEVVDTITIIIHLTNTNTGQLMPRPVTNTQRGNTETATQFMANILWMKLMAQSESLLIHQTRKLVSLLMFRK